MKVLPPDEKFSSLSTSQLVDNMDTPSPITRARILSVLGSRLSESPTVFDTIKEAIVNPINLKSRVMGLTTVSWFGVITTLENGDENQKKYISNIMQKWEEQDKSDLVHYLKDFPNYTKYIIN